MKRIWFTILLIPFITSNIKKTQLFFVGHPEINGWQILSKIERIHKKLI